jgi:hypothetical protein
MYRPKLFFKSKTFWWHTINIALYVVQWASGRQFIKPEDQVLIQAVGGYILRLVTDKPVVILPPKPPL